MEALARAWRALVGRHAILRQVVVMPGALAAGLGVIRGTPPGGWAVVELTGSSEERLGALRARDRAERFDLEQGPLIRARLAALGDGRHALLRLANHHLILDGWSLPVMLGELASLYEAERTGERARLGRAFRWQDHLAWLAGRMKPARGLIGRGICTGWAVRAG